MTSYDLMISRRCSTITNKNNGNKIKNDFWVCVTSLGVWKERTPSPRFALIRWHEATRPRDKSPPVTCLFLYNSTQRLVAWIKTSLNACDTSQRQNIARWVPSCDMHVRHFAVTTVNKPIVGLPATPSWSITRYSVDKSPRVTGP